MTELDEQSLSVEIESTGERWDNITEYSLESNYLVAADKFEFTVYKNDDPGSLRRTFRPWTRVNLYIDGDLQLIGRIYQTVGTGKSGSALKCIGYNYMRELVAASVDPSVNITEKQDLGDALLSLWKPWVRTLVGNWNLTRNILTGRKPNTVQPASDFINAKLSDFTPKAGDGAWQAGDRLVARHGFTIQQGGARGTVCIVEPMYGQDPLYDLVQGGNVMTGVADRDYSDVPTCAIATGVVKKTKKSKDADLFAKTAGIGGNGATPNPNQLLPSLEQWPVFGDLAPNELGKLDEVIRIALEPVSLLRQSRVDWKAKTMPFEPEDDVLYCPFIYEDHHSKTDAEVERGVRRELSRRLKSCLTYRCTVRGHRELSSRAIYTIDTIANVKDEIQDVQQSMWVLDRKLYNDGQSGPKTDMELILPGAIAL